ncbi:MAG TPA: hypothetical protein V6C52_00070 [Coleofasciculaceae cyanobacterium]
MIQAGKTLHRLALQGVVFSLLLSVSGLPAQAEQVLKHLGDGIPVTLKTEINGETATVGQPFEAELLQNIQYKDWVLPVGTDFRGQVAKVAHSKRFSRPGYVVLQVQEATLPSGQTFAFDESKYKPTSHKITAGDAKTFGENILIPLPYTAAGLGTTIPLVATGAVSTLSALPIGLGVRMATGATTGLFRHGGDYANKAAAERFARGALDGSGIPTVVRMVAVKEPNPVLCAGQQISLYFNKDGLQDLFQTSGASTVMSPEATTQPTAATPSE